MRKDQCKFCTSRNCHFRIVCKSKAYDEVACSVHSGKLEDDADKTLGRNNGVMRNHISSSGKLVRGMD